MFIRLLSSGKLSAAGYALVTAAAFLLAVFAQAASAQKLYKIVDENGKVSFSQFPPEGVDRSKVEDVVIKQQNAGNKVSVKRVGAREYCGKISLHKKPKNGAKAHQLSNFERTVQQWKANKARAQAQLESLNSKQLQASAKRSRYETDQSRNSRYKNYLARKDQYVKTISEYQCAINWAESTEEVSNTQQDIASINQKAAALEEVYQSIEGQQQRQCGDEPEYNPSVPQLKFSHDQWAKCRSPFNKDLAAVKRKIRDLSASPR